MAVAVVRSRALAGVHAPVVTVEVHLAGGLPGVRLVGLPEAEVREARDRVRAALQNAQFEFPARKVTVNLAPADLPKESGRFDLPIALGILAATGQIPAAALDPYEFAGELALTGELRAIRGALAMVLSARRDGRAFVLPATSAAEASLVRDAIVYPANSLLAVCAHVTGRQRLPSLLPPLAEDEALESAALASLAGRFVPERWRERPYRAPHHTASAVALVGGGSNPRPGEISLAHHGVLFLDELPEWDRRVLEVLREPLESGVINISRAARQSTYPAQFQLMAAMNPCPCGWLGHVSGRCRCSFDQIARYRGRVSGPLIDRIDLAIEVPSVSADALALSSATAPAGESSADVRERVVAAQA